MSEANKTLDHYETDFVGGLPRYTFLGIDWAKPDSDWCALICPRCSTRHEWRKRRPKRCRVCDLRFIYTSNIAKVPRKTD